MGKNIPITKLPLHEKKLPIDIATDRDSTSKSSAPTKYGTGAKPTLKKNMNEAMKAMQRIGNQLTRSYAIG